jgi:hypothetical protein
MYCRQCGKEIPTDSNFCYSCGAPVASGVSAPARSETEVARASADMATAGAEVAKAAMTNSTDERMVGLIPLLKKPKSFGRWDSYSMVITDRRSIFPQITGEMLKGAAAEAARKGKEEGKGLMARWADQLKITFNFAQRYWNIPPEDILKETPGNFAVENAAVREIKIRRKEEHRGSNDAVYQTYTEVQMDTTSGKLSYNIDGHADDEVETLKNIFGERVKVSWW